MPSVIWPIIRSLQCPRLAPPPPSTFAEILENRRSMRAMAPAPVREVVNAVAFATQPRQILTEDGLGRSRRPSPSAGALHPIEVLLVDWRGAPRAMRYNPWTHRLELLAVPAPDSLSILARSTSEILPSARGTALALVGQLSRVEGVYHEPQSLFWRDAGALLQTLFLAATAFRLAFCPLGVLGHEAVRAVGLESSLLACGIAMVGRHLESG